MNWSIDILPLLIVAIIGWTLLKGILDALPKATEKVKETKSMDERIYRTLCECAKGSSLKRHCKVYVKGDESVPLHKIGETPAGVLNYPDIVIIPIKSKWWKVLQKASMLIVEGEFIPDLYEGDIVIEGVGIHPLSEKFSFVNISQGYGKQYTDKEVQDKRNRLMERMFAELGNFDLNNDVWDNTKTGLRGGRLSSKSELIRGAYPKERPVDVVEREQRKQESEIRHEEANSGHTRGRRL